MGLTGHVASQPTDLADPAAWSVIDRAVVEQLFTENLGTVARALAAAPPPSEAAELMRRLSLFVRAGRRDRATATIELLAASTSRSDTSVPSHIADFLIDRGEWDLARQFLERMPRAEPGWGHVFIKHWAQSGNHHEIDRWLAERMNANPGYWLSQRLRFRAALGTEVELLDGLAADVRGHPTDPARVERYVDAVRMVGTEMDLDWIGEVCKPRLAYESYELGQALAERCPRVAIVLLNRSLATELTDEDQALIDKRMLQRAAAPPVSHDRETELRLWTKAALARCYTASGRADKAQPLVEELAAANEHGLPHVSWSEFAGQTQGGSGARVVEDRLIEAEAKSEKSSDYWHTRAEYYAGREEDAPTVEAFERALDLAPLDRSNAGTASSRRLILTDYARYKARTAGAREAMLLLRRDLDSIPLDTDYAAWLIDQMGEYERDGARFLQVGTDRLWAHLAARPRWGFHEERLLRRMIENLPASERNPHWSRAEALANTADPSRGLQLGCILKLANESARAVPLLETVVQRLPAGHDDRWYAAITLFEAYLTIGNWSGAEEIWPVARERLAPSEITDWLGKLAVAAARAGAREDALRLWSTKANLDRADFRHLGDLAHLGLEQQLGDFYQRMSEDDPASWVPPAALKMLDREVGSWSLPSG